MFWNFPLPCVRLTEKNLIWSNISQNPAIANYYKKHDLCIPLFWLASRMKRHAIELVRLRQPSCKRSGPWNGNGMCNSEHWDPAGFLLDILNHVLDIFIIVHDISSYFIIIFIFFVSYDSLWISLHPFPTLPPAEAVVGPTQFFAEECGGGGENQSGH